MIYNTKKRHRSLLSSMLKSRRMAVDMGQKGTFSYLGRYMSFHARSRKSAGKRRPPSNAFRSQYVCMSPVTFHRSEILLCDQAHSNRCVRYIAQPINSHTGGFRKLAQRPFHVVLRAADHPKMHVVLRLATLSRHFGIFSRHRSRTACLAPCQLQMDVKNSFHTVDCWTVTNAACACKREIWSVKLSLF